jgi:hypothetical protein
MSASSATSRTSPSRPCLWASTNNSWNKGNGQHHTDAFNDFSAKSPLREEGIEELKYWFPFPYVL